MKKSKLKQIIKDILSEINDENLNEGEFDDKRQSQQSDLWKRRKDRWKSFKEKNKCPHCNGIKLTRPCPHCNGKGVSPKRECNR